MGCNQKSFSLRTPTLFISYVTLLHNHKSLSRKCQQTSECNQMLEKQPSFSETYETGMEVLVTVTGLANRLGPFYVLTFNT